MMAYDQWDKFAARMLREAGAPGPEHERLKKSLHLWAKEKKYVTMYSELPNGSRPDVLRTTKDKEYLFVGDAKDAANETPDNKDTLVRLAIYIDEFSSILGNSGYKGGIIAIATNNADIAEQWIPALNTLACKASLTGPNGARPAFKTIKLKNERTWIIAW
jgi:hypothetical protein